MGLKRIDNVAVVVEDLDAAIAFFRTVGLELDGQMTVEGEWVDRVVGLENVRSDIAMMRSPDGHGRLELTRYQQPAAVGSDPINAPPNSLGMGRAMFNVDNIDDLVKRLQAQGGELVGEIVDYENVYRLCYMRGPEGIIIGLAQDLGG